jgi:hypoxanthine phosphoribosyltransferase
LTHPVNPSEYLRDAELIHSQEAVDLAITAIAKQLNIDYAFVSDDASDPPVILSVMGGAVYFTGQLLPQLTFALELDYVQATRYHDNTEGGQISWVVMPKEHILHKNVLILDDILDEGITLKTVVDACYARGAKVVKVAVLADKLLNKAKPLNADYVGLTVPNRYVFGCGMDVYGWWRNLPAIYALKQG